ncbi:hypothetical protein SLEP1_g31527 [Rubroshorea leprosula]|uniref:Chromo domain-containing protein n=1 Tax=Rubroshorea leprosula TaxID=152421 RepID=A0AAV5K9Z5_9ROSI|nr:hypothetical protein SLEP1_g31527 [Rubroshorea leprosula]
MEGDMVMVRIRPKRYRRRSNKKLHSRCAEPYKIIKKIISNAYVLDLLDDMGINNIFNIGDLTSYNGHDDNTSNITSADLPFSPPIKEEIEDVLDHGIVSTREGGYQRFLVKWKGCSLSNCTWIIEEEFQQLNSTLYDEFHASNSTGSSFFKQGRDDRARWKQPPKVYKRQAKVGSKAHALVWHMANDEKLSWELN